MGSQENPFVRCGNCGFAKWSNPLPTTIGVIPRGRKLLLLRRAVDPCRGLWDAVGGFLQPGESAEECLVREAREEIGVTVEPMEHLGTFVSEYGDTGLQTIGIGMTCRLSDSSVSDVLLSEENLDYGWFDTDELPHLAFADVRSCIERFSQLQSRL
jgi:ADP-ribose pyrophosphatase YjhB (NUDIX family)